MKEHDIVKIRIGMTSTNDGGKTWHEFPEGSIGTIVHEWLTDKIVEFEISGTGLTITVTKDYLNID